MREAYAALEMFHPVEIGHAPWMPGQWIDAMRLVHSFVQVEQAEQARREAEKRKRR